MENEQSTEDIIRGKSALVFCGGGVLGVGHIGALFEWEKMGGYRNLTHVCGSSVGSIVAAAVAANASVEFMKSTLFNLDFKQFEDNSTGFLRDLYRLIKKWGWNKGDAIKEWAENLMCELTGKHHITMKQLYEKSHTHLTITYWSYRYRKTKYIDHLTQPDMTVAEAIRMSSSIPIYYQAVWRKSLDANQREVLDACVDGGTMDNFPIGTLHSQGVPPEKILGFKLCGKQELDEYKAERVGEEYDFGMPENIVHALVVLVSAMREQSMKVHVKSSDWKLTVKISTFNFKSTDFNLSEQDKEKLYESGCQAMRNYMNEVRERIENGEAY